MPGRFFEALGHIRLSFGCRAAARAPGLANLSRALDDLSVNLDCAGRVSFGMDQATFKESFKVAAEQLVDAVKRLVRGSNVRRIVIKQEGRTVAEFPLTVGVVTRSSRGALPPSGRWPRSSRTAR